MLLNGRYQLLESVGSGGMAIVYRAQDNALGRIVAVKILHESLTSDQGFLERFQREAHAAANLTHPNIVTVHDIGQDGGKHYIVMEYVDGQTLKEVIRGYRAKDRQVPISRAIDLTIQICNGIGYAHRANLVHCDLKPQNVLVTRDDRVKVADFGIARAMGRVSQQLDERGLVWGTPQYFAPEQAAGQPATPASDVYAIGVVFFELLCGRPPFRAEKPASIALKHLHEPPPFASDLNPAVPQQLAQIVRKVLAKEPSGRYRTAGQLGRILSTYRERSRETTGPMKPVATETVTRSPAVPVTEQKTRVFQRTNARRLQPTAMSAPASAARPKRQPAPPPVKTVHITPRGGASQTTDWVTIILGVIALITLLGLMPVWYFVYRAWAG